MRKQQIIKAIVCFTYSASLITSCASLQSPNGWLPKVNEVQSQAYGCWITVEYVNQGQAMVRSGELIAITPEKLFVLSESGISEIPGLTVKRTRLEIFKEKKLAGLSALGTLSTLSHGYFIILSAPVWIISWTSLAVAESRAGLIQFEGHSPESIQKYARFPQGLPKGIDLGSLKMKSIQKK